MRAAFRRLAFLVLALALVAAGAREFSGDAELAGASAASHAHSAAVGHRLDTPSPGDAALSGLPCPHHAVSGQTNPDDGLPRDKDCSHTCPLCGTLGLGGILPAFHVLILPQIAAPAPARFASAHLAPRLCRIAESRALRRIRSERKSTVLAGDSLGASSI